MVYSRALQTMKRASYLHIPKDHILSSLDTHQLQLKACFELSMQ